ncbi:pilin [Wohlfahrtiimonas larvae]|uniref:pilin n=1 Tax=Wohlfahrtiimonas larvae TaxID=1157986 RepID=UPI0015590C3D|nr:pilin [Wohlfahrtiimonas larvae]
MKNNKGFSLIELMIVVAIIGILAMIAMPSYQEYVARTYVTEGLSVATSVQSSMIDHYISNGSFVYKHASGGSNGTSNINDTYGIAPPESFAHNAITRVATGTWWNPMGITIEYSKDKLGLSNRLPANQVPKIMLVPSPTNVESDIYLQSTGANWKGGSITWQCYYMFMPRIIAPANCQEAAKDFSTCSGTNRC